MELRQENIGVLPCAGKNNARPTLLQVQLCETDLQRSTPSLVDYRIVLSQVIKKALNLMIESLWWSVLDSNQ